MMDRLKLNGLTQAEAERCLDWLQNQGYSGCSAQLQGDVWDIVMGSEPLGGRPFVPFMGRAQRSTTRLPAAGS